MARGAMRPVLAEDRYSWFPKRTVPCGRSGPQRPEPPAQKDPLRVLTYPGPRTFSLCERRTGSHPSDGRAHLRYLDDALIAADFREKAATHTELVVNHLQAWGSA